MQHFDPLQQAFWLPVGMACLCGTLIGLERQLRGKPVGIRTSVLICLSTQVFISLSRVYAGENGDLTRVLGQVVTGVGFLGGGVILARGGVVTGVTTAALIWILAAIGALIGFGEYKAGLAITLLVLVCVVGVGWLESSIRNLRRGVHAAPDQEKPK